ncbi:unnamed protein product [Psylliodes chrysocephalus]|uniref:Cell cycle checkpoint control protein n=1 Tax=Psylliodes chrysocephalus TaxID=3402493 RepID=A0A9P0CLN9_9CUCU|nr:unnamed protein product [Psylliodes chrysocephala]
MNCIIPGQNLKVFARALNALARIGDDLYVEASKEQLHLVTLNLRKTVCVRYDFKEIFFSNYEINEAELGGTESVSCKIHLKTLLPLFKGTHLDKKLDYVKIEYENNSDFIIFKMKYKCDEILMRHTLRLMESETLTIGISPDNGCNNIGTTSTFCNQLLNMFSNSDDEILFEITKDKAVVRNYYVGAPVRPKSVRSQVNLNGSEFTMFRIDQETTINFSLKPFRTAIQFAEAFNLSISLNFEKGGKPLSVLMTNPTFEVSFIVATLNPYSDNQSSMSTEIPAKITQFNNNHPNITVEDQQALLAEDWDDLSLEVNNKLPIKRTTKSSSNSSSKEPSFREIVEQARSKRSRRFSNDENTNVDRSEVREEDTEPAVNVEENEVSISPESPKTKKAKLVFGRCFEMTFSRDRLGVVLAPNSDSE